MDSGLAITSTLSVASSIPVINAGGVSPAHTAVSLPSGLQSPAFAGKNERSTSDFFFEARGSVVSSVSPLLEARSLSSSSVLEAADSPPRDTSQLPWLTAAHLRSMPFDALREHAMLLYSTLGPSKIGVQVPKSQIEVVAWISTVQRLHLDPNQAKAAPPPAPTRSLISSTGLLCTLQQAKLDANKVTMQEADYRHDDKHKRFADSLAEVAEDTDTSTLDIAVEGAFSAIALQSSQMPQATPESTTRDDVLEVPVTLIQKKIAEETCAQRNVRQQVVEVVKEVKVMPELPMSVVNSRCENDEQIKLVPAVIKEELIEIPEMLYTDLLRGVSEAGPYSGENEVKYSAHGSINKIVEVSRVELVADSLGNERGDVLVSVPTASKLNLSEDAKVETVVEVPPAAFEQLDRQVTPTAMERSKTVFSEPMFFRRSQGQLAALHAKLDDAGHLNRRPSVTSLASYQSIRTVSIGSLDSLQTCSKDVARGEKCAQERPVETNEINDVWIQLPIVDRQQNSRDARKSETQETKNSTQMSQNGQHDRNIEVAHREQVDSPRRMAQQVIEFADRVVPKSVYQHTHGNVPTHSVLHSHKDAEAAEALTFEVLEAVEVYSISQQQWIGGVILEILPDGAVRVQYGASQKMISREQCNLVLRKAGEAPKFELHEAVEVYSVSQQQWISGAIVEFMPDGAVRVQYGTSQKFIAREHCNSGTIRKATLQDKRQSVSSVCDADTMPRLLHADTKDAPKDEIRAQERVLEVPTILSVEEVRDLPQLIPMDKVCSDSENARYEREVVERSGPQTPSVEVRTLLEDVFVEGCRTLAEMAKLESVSCSIHDLNRQGSRSELKRLDGSVRTPAISREASGQLLRATELSPRARRNSQPLCNHSSITGSTAERRPLVTVNASAVSPLWPRGGAVQAASARCSSPAKIRTTDRPHTPSTARISASTPASKPSGHPTQPRPFSPAPYSTTIGGISSAATIHDVASASPYASPLRASVIQSTPSPIPIRKDATLATNQIKIHPASVGSIPSSSSLQATPIVAVSPVQSRVVNSNAPQISSGGFPGIAATSYQPVSTTGGSLGSAPLVLGGSMKAPLGNSMKAPLGNSMKAPSPLRR